jgi:predicted 3-demethylubiquinone-9 3-methyltransferase (glyoxalase superfamily)
MSQKSFGSAQDKITPFLWFDKNCEEALNFYTSIFKNAKIVSMKRYPDSGLQGPMQGMEGKVLTAVFELEGQTFMALDGGPYFKPTGAVSFYVACKDQAEVDYYWDKLTVGGDPNAQQCGWLLDKFGFSWQIIPDALPQALNDPDPVKAGRAMQAMLTMKKIEIAKLK